MMKRVLCILLGGLFTGSSFGAGISIRGEDRTYFIALFHPAAECRIEEPSETGVEEARCAANGFHVTATAASGCGDSVGPTYCASTRLGDATVGANELYCETAAGYVLSAGLGEVRCKGYEGYKQCVSADGASAAEASCESGCGTVKGGGVCCVAGSEGCPPGLVISETKSR